VTDWGLVELGSLNQNLRYLNVTTDSKYVSENGILLLRNSLSRISEQNFSVTIPDPTVVVAGIAVG